MLTDFLCIKEFAEYMIKKRLLEIVPESKKYIAMNVLFQWLGMCCNIVMMHTIAQILSSLSENKGVSFGQSTLIMILAGVFLFRTTLYSSLFLIFHCAQLSTRTNKKRSICYVVTDTPLFCFF